MEISRKTKASLSASEFISSLTPDFNIASDNNNSREVNEIFRKGSTTYFNSSRFFPLNIRRDVSGLYAFVRIADNYVDSIPQCRDGFYLFSSEFENCFKSGTSDNTIIRGFVSIMDRTGIEVEHVRAFLKSMEMDLYRSIYNTVEDVLEYIYGSAEVIGLMMHRILGLDKSSEYYAAVLGRAMQFLNFIRDVNEDNSLGRIYLPAEEMREHGLSDLREKTARSNPKGFVTFMRSQLDRFFEWDREARKGFRSIPSRSLIPVKTAEDMYLWTGRRIYSNPMIVFEKKVKPEKARIVSRVVLNSIGLPIWKF
ncbi:MAG: phytoene/squalene synthase family protein [Thermoplasmataceae archaeon]